MQCDLFEDGPKALQVGGIAHFARATALAGILGAVGDATSAINRLECCVGPHRSLTRIVFAQRATRMSGPQGAGERHQGRGARARRGHAGVVHAARGASAR